MTKTTSREIKFRAWDKEEGRMVYQKSGYSFNFGSRNWSVTFFYEDELGEDKSTTKLGQSYDLMQFTGLKDKNGVEIYEGDILTDGIKNGVVEFTLNVVSPCYVLRTNVDKFPMPFTLFKYDSLEIIGNIHEHPDLL